MGSAKKSFFLDKSNHEDKKSNSNSKEIVEQRAPDLNID